MLFRTSVFLVLFGGNPLFAAQIIEASARELPLRENAMQTQGGRILPLYEVTAPASRTRAVAYEQSGDTVRAIDRREQEIWIAQPGIGALFGGFDFNQDGWPDLGLAQATPNGGTCGGSPTLDTFMVLLDGKDGTLHTPIAPLPDICWNFGGTIYATSQWTTGTLLFGAHMATFVATPYYATNSWFMRWNGASFTSDYFYYPSTNSYDVNYVNDQPNAWGTGTSYIANAHVANGLIADVGGQDRLVFFTSGRVVQYEVGPFSASQLIADFPFVSGGNTYLAGRNYGLVAMDPAYSDNLVLIAGTTAYSLYADTLSGTMAWDIWGQIERHVAVYNMALNGLNDRFFSYALNNNGADQYEGRVVYPNGIFLETAPGSPSRLIYNVYESGRWNLHISEPGATSDRFALLDVFVWDVRDLDGDGQVEIIASPTKYPHEPDVPGYYFSKWDTTIYHWDEPTLTLIAERTYSGLIPYLIPTFRKPVKTTSLSYLYPVLTIAQGGDLKIAFIDPSANIQLRSY